MRITFYGKDLLNDISISIEAGGPCEAHGRLLDLLKCGNTNNIADRYSTEYESDISEIPLFDNDDDEQQSPKDQKPKKWIVEKLDSIAYEDRYDYLVGWYANIEDVHYCAHCGKVIAQGETVYWDDEDLFCFNCAECYGAPQPYETTGWRVYSADRCMQYGSYASDSEELARQAAKNTSGRLVRLIKRIA